MVSFTIGHCGVFYRRPLITFHFCRASQSCERDIQRLVDLERSVSEHTLPSVRAIAKARNNIILHLDKLKAAKTALEVCGYILVRHFKLHSAMGVILVLCYFVQ